MQSNSQPIRAPVSEGGLGDSLRSDGFRMRVKYPHEVLVSFAQEASIARGPTPTPRAGFSSRKAAPLAYLRTRPRGWTAGRDLIRVVRIRD
jgi:hypothetical protein